MLQSEEDLLPNTYTQFDRLFRAVYAWNRVLYFNTKKRSSLYKMIGGCEMDMFCANDDVYCQCRDCAESQINGGTCSHCCCCIDGEKAMDTCAGYKNNEIEILEK